jgi:hypothetical protein
MEGVAEGLSVSSRWEAVDQSDLLQRLELLTGT